MIAITVAKHYGPGINSNLNFLEMFVKKIIFSQFLDQYMNP